MKPDYYDAKIAALESMVDSLEAEITHGADRAQAVIDINNLMGKYTFYARYAMYNRVLSFFADREDISLEVADLGVYIGKAKIADFYKKYCAAFDGKGYGVLHEHAVSTPVIEVAGDGLTAKGVWLSPGHEAFPTNREDANVEETEQERGHKVRSSWVYGKFAVEFVKENGVWKIWHMQYFRTFQIGFYDSWTDIEKKDAWTGVVRSREVVDSFTGGPSAESTFTQEYDPQGTLPFWPQPPKPYETYEGSDSVVGAPKA
jgi:hypothetical protein